MTHEQIDIVATTMEGIWSSSFYKKDHKSLVSSILITMSDCEHKRVMDIIRDYANNFDNVPTVASISRLAHQKESAKKFEKVEEKKYSSPKYFEDEDGYGYMLNAEHEYECIWKPNWLKRGITKMESLKKHGLINY